MPPLDARIEAEKLRTLYESDPMQQSFSVLLLGEKGSGKTSILKTARKPVHIDSFDPGGTIPLRDEIKKGNIVADTRWENENPLRPTVYREWKRTFEERLGSNYFSRFGTYCLDSSTVWSQAIMNYVLLTVDKKGDATTTHVGEPPKWNRDYKPQRNEIELQLKRMLTIPCDRILTGHLAPVFDTRIVGGEEQQVLCGYRMLTTGQGDVIIPLWFSEQWLTWRSESSTGVNYQILTRMKGFYKGSTRIGGGKFAELEEPNIKNLLKKAGWPSEDKESLFK